MELLIDISRKSFTVGRPFDRKVDDNGVQRVDRKTGAPQWSAQLVVMDDRGADTIVVTITGDPPQLQQGQPVTPVALVALPWNRNGRRPAGAELGQRESSAPTSEDASVQARDPAARCRGHGVARTPEAPGRGTGRSRGTQWG